MAGRCELFTFRQCFQHAGDGAHPYVGAHCLVGEKWVAVGINEARRDRERAAINHPCAGTDERVNLRHAAHGKNAPVRDRQRFRCHKSSVHRMKGPALDDKVCLA